MSRYRPWLLSGLLIGCITFTVMGQNPPAPQRTSPAVPQRTSPLARLSGLQEDWNPQSPGPTGKPADSGAQAFLTQAKAMLADGRPAEAKEALKTAIRLEPMNIEGWNLYDRAVEAEYLLRAREEKVSPVIERDLKPVFAIDRVESYTEYNSLYVVGELRNVSDAMRQRIELSAELFDENKQELRRESGRLRLKDRGLFPSESSLFEIEFPNPPPGVKSYRVRVTNYE
ncbi:MAG TPA: FxLYD domain-containing protein [Candidatus Ozemobacteraceae bacterium]|nr:MAG: hypothetical protein BWY66_02742 [bacterium ADurb.Bin374]HOT28609.1 FxLYD domain-containing protein [Candidatus Ozemobacteraceae bacterium]